MKEIKAKHYVDTTIHLYDLIIKTLKSYLKQKIDKLNIGITSEQLVVLDTITCYDNMYQQKLSEILMKDKSNTTRIIKVLSDKKLITKEIGTVNKRLAYILKVTDKGQKILDENMPKIKKYIEDMFSNISDEEVEMLHNLSKKVNKDLKKEEKAEA